MNSILSERQTDHEIALVLIGTQQGGYGITEILRSPARVTEFRSDSNVPQLEFDASAKRSADIRIFIELGDRRDIDVCRSCRILDLINSRNVPEVRSEIHERASWSSKDRPFSQHRE